MARRIKKREGIQVDMTPLIDMMFLLIIFFLIATSFQTYKKISVTLPGSETGENPANEPFIITILRDESILIEEQKYTLSQFNEYLKNNLSSLSSRQIYLNADRDVSYETIIKILDILRKNSLQSISLGVKPY
ncbi:MAG: biopolymer transporter ExbD [Spirochaetales bacterium]|jgi:biopolymer transport protein ExbD|nr:biopolymer transporter ExbD [Exilispira sp.]NMC66691.1 biopolymer transporter ExbD [Spirochaetales bacterium]